jgi:branched-subunit amino acid ABC-type transport system permease component
LLEGAGTAFFPATWVPVLEFVLFVLILLVRPSGLLGKRQ